MKGQAGRVVAAALAALSAAALVAAAILLLNRGDDNAPVQIIPPEPATALPGEATVSKAQISGEVLFPGVYPANPRRQVARATQRQTADAAAPG